MDGFYVNVDKAVLCGCLSLYSTFAEQRVTGSHRKVTSMYYNERSVVKFAYQTTQVNDTDFCIRMTCQLCNFLPYALRTKVPKLAKIVHLLINRDSIKTISNEGSLTSHLLLRANR